MGYKTWQTDGTQYRDRQLTVFASAARTATANSGALVNPDACGVYVVFDATTVTSGASLVLTIDGYDAASGKWFNLLTGAAVTGVSTNVYKIGPALTAASNVTANAYLPQDWRVVVTAADSKSVTYSVGAVLVR